MHISTDNKVARAIASFAVCALGAFSMWASNGSTGVGWSILGIAIIWME